MRLRTIVALGCVLFAGTPACSMSRGGAAAPYAYAGPTYGSPTREARGESTGDTLNSGSFADTSVQAEEIVVTGASADVASMESDNDFFGAGGGEDKPKVTAASAPPPPPPPPAPAGKKDEAPAKEAPATLPVDPSAASGKKPDDGMVAVMRAPMLIYTARVHMAVYEVKSSLGEVESLARYLGGFLAQRNDRSITIRVPAAQFDDAIRRIEKLGDMLSRDVSAEDVTEEYHDTEIRLKNARAVRERLEQLLAKAVKVEESIQIEKELERVAEIIDRLEGRMKFLRDRAAFSTITVTFQPRSAAELGKRPFNLPVPWLYELGLGRLLSL